MVHPSGVCRHTACHTPPLGSFSSSTQNVQARLGRRYKAPIHLLTLNRYWSPPLRWGWPKHPGPQPPHAIPARSFWPRHPSLHASALRSPAVRLDQLPAPKPRAPRRPAPQAAEPAGSAATADPQRRRLPPPRSPGPPQCGPGVSGFPRSGPPKAPASASAPANAVPCLAPAAPVSRLTRHVPEAATPAPRAAPVTASRSRDNDRKGASA